MKLIVVAVVVLCVWAGDHIVQALPPHPPRLTDQVPQFKSDEVEPPRGRFMVTVTWTTKTVTATEISTVLVYPTCITSTADVSTCPTGRALSLPIATSKPAQPHNMHMTVSPEVSRMSKKSDLEVGELLLPSYAQEEYSPRNARVFNWVLATGVFTSIITTDVTKTQSEASTTITLEYGEGGCIPADAPTLICAEDGDDNGKRRGIIRTRGKK